MGICLKESMNLSVDIGAVIVIQLIFAAMQRGEPMDDLISRQAAIDGKICIQRSNGVEIYDDYAVPVEYLEQLPPIQPKRGKWIKTARWGRVYYCNQCRNYLDFDGVNAGRGSTNFCPNCGADMREVTT